jgi:putative FmdB family regulatory protein
MPTYEFRCRACWDTFEVTRRMIDSAEPATCPAGHDDTVKLLSAVPVTGRAAAGTTPAAAPATPATGSGGGCCGGACGCG